MGSEKNGPQRIAYPDDPFMAGAWASAVRVAAENPGIVASYEADRGRKFLLAGARTPLDRMIDEATGAEAASVNDFVDWFNVAVWGDDPFAAEQEDPDATQ